MRTAHVTHCRASYKLSGKFYVQNNEKVILLYLVSCPTKTRQDQDFFQDSGRWLQSVMKKTQCSPSGRRDKPPPSSLRFSGDRQTNKRTKEQTNKRISPSRTALLCGGSLKRQSLIAAFYVVLASVQVQRGLTGDCHMGLDSLSYCLDLSLELLEGHAQCLWSC